MSQSELLNVSPELLERLAVSGPRYTSYPTAPEWSDAIGETEALDAYHRAHITRERLLKGCPSRRRRAGIRPSVRWEVMKRDGFRCVKCGRGSHCQPPVELEVDHKHPHARGGSDGASNLQTLCVDCNRGKGCGDDA